MKVEQTCVFVDSNTLENEGGDAFILNFEVRIPTRVSALEMMIEKNDK